MALTRPLTTARLDASRTLASLVQLDESSITQIAPRLPARHFLIAGAICAMASPAVRDGADQCLEQAISPDEEDCEIRRR